MGDFASPALQQNPPLEAERQRIRELSRYYCTIGATSSTLEEPQPESSSLVSRQAPSISPDITLNALTQLAVYRFGCNRSFVSLIDDQNQHIIAEATASISLQDKQKHNTDDGVYLGVTTLDLVFGVCPDAVKLFTGQHVPALKNSANMTANPTRFIVRDFTLEDHYKDRAYVVQWPHFRFYAEVPIYSPSGYVLGSFCVVDNKPRAHFGDDEVLALQEISDSISQHLENVRTVHSHRRSDRLVQGLTTFATRRSDCGVSSISSEQDESLAVGLPSGLSREQSPSPREDRLNIDSLSLSTEPTDEPSPSLLGPVPTESTNLTTPSCQSQVAEQPEPGMDGCKTQAPPEEYFEDDQILMENVTANAPLVAVKEDTSTSKRIASLFAHASTSLREAMDLEGVLFVDACKCNAGIVRSVDATEWEPFPKIVDPRLSGSTPSFLPGSSVDEELCDTLGSAGPNYEAQHDSQRSVPVSLLQYMIAMFPHGEIFHLDDPIIIMPSMTTDSDVARQARRESVAAGHELVPNDECQRLKVAAQLLHHFPDAKSVIFLPLWDLDKSQWLAGTFLWTRDQQRALGREELHYFKAFGDSITSEVARVNWSRQEYSKSNFISSISHELRSPLHGMLASAELLSAMNLQEDQRDTVTMIETCGLTLLDTLNHLLDFTKINNLRTLKDENTDFYEASMASLVSTFELDVLLEEVLKAIYLGKVHAVATTDTMSAPAARHNHAPEAEGNGMSVVVRVERQSAWKVQSITGAWRRIIMNIFGNALKYTQSGFVEVSLTKMKKSSDSNEVMAYLSITDSGRGMSSDFLRNKLFSPFAQEDPLAEGVGLGLSVVKQLVTVLHGYIDIRSEPDVGTQVDIMIPVQFVAPTPHESVIPSPVQAMKPIQFCLIGFGAQSDLTDVPTGTLSSEAKRKLCLQSFFTQLVDSETGWSFSFAEEPSNAAGNVAIVEESALEKLTQSDGDASLSSALSAKFSRFVILSGAGTSTNTIKLGDISHVVRITQPFCPRKALDALIKIAELEDIPAPQLVVEPAVVLEGSLTTEKVELEVSITVIQPDNSTVSPESTIPEGNARVLIIDDNAINVKVLSKYMRKLGWEYDTASNGLIALKKYQESPASYRVLLMDISMPVMDGITSTRYIRAFEQERGLPPVTIFAVTGVGSSTMKEQALTAGVDGYMIKPLSLQQLEVVMHQIMCRD